NAIERCGETLATQLEESWTRLQGSFLSDEEEHGSGGAQQFSSRETEWTPYASSYGANAAKQGDKADIPKKTNKVSERSSSVACAAAAVVVAVGATALGVLWNTN
ncbi:hypothetical protein CBR_g73988, partial [Chara braunii]